MTAYPHAQHLVMNAGGQQYKAEYSSNYSIEQENFKITDALIAIHGGGSPGWDYYELALSITSANHTESHTLVIAPQFTRPSDIDPADLDAFSPDSLMWTGGYPHGGDADLPLDTAGNPPQVSSFDVVDQIIEKIVAAMSSIQTIAIFGHSGGGHFVQRYAICSPVEDLVVRPRGIAMRYITANAGNYLFLNSQRPVAVPSGCTGWDDYGFGFAGGYPPYFTRKSITAQEQRERYADRHIIYLIAGNDNDPNHHNLPTNCKSAAQGDNRYTRSTACFNSMASTYGSRLLERQSHAVIPGVGHSGVSTFRHSIAQHFLFYPRGKSLSLIRTGDSSETDAGVAQEIRLAAISMPTVTSSYYRDSADRTRYASTDQLVSAQIDVEGRLQLRTWRRRRDGDYVSPTAIGTSGRAGRASGIELARSNFDLRTHDRGDGNIFVTSCITSSDQLKLIAWRVTASGQFRRLGSITSPHGNVTNQKFVAPRVIDQLASSRDNGVFVTVSRDAAGDVYVQLWRLDASGSSWTAEASVTIQSGADNELAIDAIDENRIAVAYGVNGKVKLSVLETDAISLGGTSMVERTSIELELPSKSMQMAVDQYRNVVIAGLTDSSDVHLMTLAVAGFVVDIRGDWPAVAGPVGSERLVLKSLEHRGLLMGVNSSTGRLKLIVIALSPDGRYRCRIADSGGAIGDTPQFAIMSGELPHSKSFVWCAKQSLVFLAGCKSRSGEGSG